MTPGFIIPIGGAEEKLSGRTILRRFADLCGGAEARIVIIPTASSIADTSARYEQVFTDLGVGHVASLPFEERSDCERADWLAELEQAISTFAEPFTCFNLRHATAAARYLFAGLGEETRHVMGARASDINRK